MNLSRGRAKILTPRERKFLKHYLQGMDATHAYLEAVRLPDGTYPIGPETAKATGCRMLARLRRKPALFQDILSAAEIDDYAVAADLHWARNAMKTEFYQGEAVADVTDNNTRMRALELITELLGHKKAALELTGTLGLKGYANVSPDDWDDPAGSAPQPAAPEVPPA